MPKTILSAFRWTGTKRYLAAELIAKFPPTMNSYYEQFVGSGAVVAKLILSPIRWNRIICSDINPYLIAIWKIIQDNPQYLLDVYTEKWTYINQLTTEPEKQKYYNEQRDEFNQTLNPLIFFFLCRHSQMGMVRFNQKGEYNVPYHLLGRGASPKRVAKLFKFWHDLIQPIEFRCCDYQEIKPEINDFSYLDPPYFNGSSPIYSQSIDPDKFVQYIRDLKCKFLLTLGGKNDKKDNTFVFPEDMRSSIKHEYLPSGNGSFRRIHGDNKNMVYESIFFNY